MQPCPIEKESRKVKQTYIQSNTVNHVFVSKDDMQKSLKRFCYGDLYVIGRIWTEALRSALVGGRINLFPVVEAAKKPETPQRPPPMKYKDLPIYESPHYEYKDYIIDKEKCPEANVKLLHRILLPYVRQWRKDTEETLCEAKCALTTGLMEIKQSFKDTSKQVKTYMRDPNRLAIRQGVVAAGAIVGYFLGYGGGVPRRLIFTGLGLLSAGSLCFPVETDEAFKNFVYQISKCGLVIYNKWCGKQITLRERVPCKTELPLTPPKRSQIKCPVKKS